jgi:hypothetical protein
MSKISVAALDPGIKNIGGWIGTLDLERCEVKTLYGMRGDDTSDSKKHKRPVYEISADVALKMIGMMMELETQPDQVIVETAQQWNVPARISAAAIYGTLTGSGIPARFSSGSTKASAMAYFAERLGLDLERVPEGTDRKDKKQAEVARRINKRNSVMVVTALMEHSHDELGRALLEKFKDKKDDVADAVLLACGGVITPKPVKRSKKRITAPTST